MKENKCILVIDDEPDIREIAKLSFQITRSWQVVAAGSGPDGVTQAATHQPDAILLDVVMPLCDGLATLKMLKAQAETANIPVILLTATAKLATHGDFLKAGAQGIITKPFDPGTVADQLEGILAWESMPAAC
jgi:CheY-like chemotaxis protein